MAAEGVTKKMKKVKVVEKVEEAEAPEESPCSTAAEESPAVEKTKKKKSKKTEEPAEEEAAAVEEEAVEEPVKEKKKKKKSKAVEEEAETVEAAAEEEEKPKKKKMKTAETEEVVEEEKEEEPAAKRQKVEEEEAKPEEGLTVFIGGLPWSMTEDQIKADFGECGEIADFKMLMDRETGKPKGIAFCTFKTQEAVKKALDFNETDYGGRTIGVRVAENGGKGKGKDGKGKGKGKKGMVQSEKPEDCKSVVVKNMSWETTEESIRALFEPCGEISRVHILTDRETGASKGMCFIDFEESIADGAVDKAVKLSEKDMDGRNIFVDYNGGGKGKGKDGKGKDGKGKGKDGKGKGKGKDGKGKGKGKKGSDPTFAARNGSIQQATGTAQTFDSDSD